MAVTDKIRESFEREHGYALRDAFEITQPQRASGRKQKRRPKMISRGYPMWGNEVSLENIDSQNELLAESLAKKTGKSH